MLYKSLWVIDDTDINELLLKYTDSQHTYTEGSLIYQQDDAQDYLFFLVNGRIKVNLIDSKGTEKTLAIHEPGSFFGETAFFDQYPSFTNAQALKDSVVLFFTKKQLTNLFTDYPEIVFQIFESMGRKIRLLAFQVEYMSFLKIEQRVVALLLSLFESFGKECSINNTSLYDNCTFKGNCIEGHHLEITITDQEIAEMIGTRREAVTKAINNLKKQKLICKQKRTICCPDLNKLNDFLTNSD
ncbi:Crp/Fnr family transcriptional regulator [Gudongella sp. DL1XJH-153]|uniref:Crp/Fnr family transcriptional regulator n=1 Tax=Gudongella sp. DL1XJH-153 TaxID=3409804 RepID=UPI003BB581F8